jgi:putative transposase
MEYRRAKSPGSSYFFTLVTHNRRPILCEPENINLLRDSFKRVIQQHPFVIDAIVILPEHLHCLYPLQSCQTWFGFFSKKLAVFQF